MNQARDLSNREVSTGSTIQLLEQEGATGWHCSLLESGTSNHANGICMAATGMSA
jgi:hypothetical protein